MENYIIHFKINKDFVMMIIKIIIMIFLIKYVYFANYFIKTIISDYYFKIIVNFTIFYLIKFIKNFKLMM